MGLLYLDATRNWSDPASTDLLYLREDRTWAKPDTDHRFLDATNGYSVPELGPKTHAITYKLGGYALSRGCVWFSDDNPSSAVAGETVRVHVYRSSKSSSAECCGYTATGVDLTAATSENEAKLHDKRLLYMNDYDGDWYPFTMPDNDVIVWGFCAKNAHEYSPGVD